jgi:hypothetical protein
MNKDIQPASREDAARAASANLQRLAEQIERGEFESVVYSDSVLTRETTQTGATSETHEMTGSRVVTLLLQKGRAKDAKG